MRFTKVFFIQITIFFFFSSFVHAGITPVALKNSKVLKYQNEKGKEVRFKVLKRSGFTTTYETTMDAFGEEYELVGGIASSGGRPFNPRHNGLSNSIDDDNRLKIKNFLSKSTGHKVKYTVLEEWNNGYTSEWTLISKIVSKRKQSISGKVWNLIEISTKGECTNADSTSSWAEDGAKFFEKRLIDASTGITLTFSRTWKDPPRYGYEDNYIQTLQLKSFVAALSENKRWEARKKKEQEEKKRKLLAERKRKEEIARQKELARKKLIAERKKKEQEEIKRKHLAERKKKEREEKKRKLLAERKRKKEIARKKLLAERRKKAAEKKKKLLAKRKRIQRLQLKLFPPLSSQANELSNDIQLFLRKNPETPYLLEIATFVGKVKESQKKKEVLRLKKRLDSLRKLLPKVKGYVAFEAKIQKARTISKLKLLTKKVKSGKDLRSFLKSFIAKNMLNDLETVQKILPVLKKLDASLKSPKLDELNKLIPKIQYFILKNSSLRKEVVKLRKKKELARKKALEAKRKRILEEKRIKALEAKRKRILEEKRKKALEAKRKKALAEKLKKEKLAKKGNFENKIAKMDDFAITEIVQKKIDAKKFKEARRYAKNIEDPDIRSLLLSKIQKENKSEFEQKKKSEKAKLKKTLVHKRTKEIKPKNEIQINQKESDKIKLLAVRKRVEELKRKYALKKEKFQKKQ